MPLLNHRLLRETVTKHKHEALTTTKQDLQALFKDTLYRIENGKFKKEESEKVPFLQKLFEVLGYKLHENLEFEYSTQGRSIDGVLGLQTEKGRDVEVAIEWKGIDTKNLNSGKAGETPVSQMWDYMGKVGAEIGIVGNFLEFRVYTLKTKQTEYQEYFLRELATQDDKLDEFIFLLKPQTLLKNQNKQSLLESLIAQSDAQQEQITKRFYNDYKQRRLSLFEHLIENNLETNKHLLLEKSQKILDRLVFIMFCEDGLLLPNGTIKQVFETARNSFGGETKIWEQFKGLFNAIDKGSEYPKINAFNGGLFAQDLELNSLMIKDNIWVDLIKLAEYDFESDLNVNILGHIFEQSISDIEEIKEGIEKNSPLEGWQSDRIDGVDSKTKTSKRKKDGIYYTPEYITDYIVSETIGAWLADQEIRPTNLASIFKSQNSISLDLQEVLKIVLDTEDQYLPGESIANTWRNLNLDQFFNYINSWYFYNDLSVKELTDWLGETDSKEPRWMINLANLLIKICKTANISNCFQLNQSHFQIPKKTNSLQTIKVLDPAGGSGAFPNQVHNYLAKKHVEQIKNKAEKEGFDPNLVDIDEKLIDKSILQNNIFMVDLQPESVEIAKLSLWLKTAKKDQKLNNLDQNVKCGNSLISDPEIAGSSAFDWDQEFPEVMASGGFDVIVGNPPYVRQEILGHDLKNSLVEKFPEVGNGTADLYVYFFAQALRLLKDGGYLGFIAPNKWMERKYGFEMRKYLKEFEIVSIVNFGEVRIFEDASTEPAIIILKKSKNQNPIKYSLINNIEEAQNILNYKYINCHKEDLNDEIWRFSDPKVNEILSKIQENSTTLEEYTKGGSITRGILTGLNKAFIIDKKTRDEILLKDPKSADIIKPMLEGDDFDRWALINPNSRFMIATGFDLDVPSLYPEVFKYLTQFQTELETRQDKGKKWWNLRACDYYDELVKPKIVYYHTAVNHKFYLDSEGYYISANCYFIANADKFLQAIFNSKLFAFLKGFLFPAFGIAENGGRVRLDANKMRNFPIPQALQTQKDQISILVDRITKLKKQSQNLANTFVNLISAKYLKPPRQSSTATPQEGNTKISTKLKNWYKLEINELLDELKKQKAVIGGLSEQSELMVYFEEQKTKVLTLEKEIELVDQEIEQLVRGLYGVGKA